MGFAGLNANGASCPDDKSTHTWIQHSVCRLQAGSKGRGLPALQPPSIHQGHPNAQVLLSIGSWVKPSFTRLTKRQQNTVTPGLGLLALSCHQFALLAAGVLSGQPPSVTHRRAACAHLPGGRSVRAAATQGLPLSNPALCASKNSALFLQGIPLQSHSRQIRHVTEEHVSEIHTPGQRPHREGEKKQPPNWTLFAKSSLITDLSKLSSHHHWFSAATITLNEL